MTTVLRPGQRYEDILDTERISVTISHPLAIDARNYAHELGMSLSRFVQIALKQQVRRAQEQLEETKLTPKEWSEKHERAIDRILKESEFIQSGVFTREELDKGKEGFER